MSQPALSRNLKKLEQDLGVTLFTREARGIKLTPEGAFVGERAQAMVAMADRMERELHTVHSRLTGSIASGCAETLSMSRQAMAELLKKLETSGHISRRPSRRDSRVMMVNLTNQGRKAADLLGKAPDQTSSMLDCLNETELQTLHGYLQRIIDTSSDDLPTSTAEDVKKHELLIEHLKRRHMPADRA